MSYMDLQRVTDLYLFIHFIEEVQIYTDLYGLYEGIQIYTDLYGLHEGLQIYTDLYN